MFSRNFFCVALVVWSILFFNDYTDALTMAQIQNIARGVRNVCVGKTGVDIALVDGMWKGEFPEDESLQCYVKCVATSLKSFKNGKPYLDGILKQIALMPEDMQDRIRAAAMHCTTLELSGDQCVAAWEFMRCEYNFDPAAFFFP